jgi:hypothetical protein
LLNLIALIVAIYRAFLTWNLPPTILPFFLTLPLSLPNGAIPIKEEVCFLDICSISGKNPIIVEDKTLPTPGMLSITLTFWLRSLLFFKRVSI